MLTFSKEIKISFNDNCSICLDDFDNTSIQLKCKHSYHSKCMITYIETEFNRVCKKHNTERVLCKQFKCPLCRTFIDCKDIHSLMYKYYKEQKTKYKQLNIEIKELQNKIYILSIKFRLRKIFKHIPVSEVYTFLLEDETILESIMKKKVKCQESKDLMNTYKKLYYGRCLCNYI